MAILGGVAPHAIGGQQRSSRSTGANADSTCLIEFVEVSAATHERRLLLQIFEDGQVQAASPARGGPVAQDRLKRDLAAELARNISEQLKKSDVSNDSLAAERKAMSARTGLSADFPDADELILKVRQNDTTYQVGCRAVELLAQRFPDAQRNQALLGIHEKLLNVIAVAQAGGMEAARRLAAEATRKLHAEHPAARDWTSDELCSIRCLPNKSRFIQFRRKETHLTGTEESVEYWVTNIIEMPGEPARVSVVAPDRVTR